MAEVPHRRALVRGNVSSFVATLADFAGYHGVLAVAGVVTGDWRRYVLGTAIATGALLGAVTNFSINRAWTFEARAHGPRGGQALRYALVSLLILAYNETFIHLLVLGLRADRTLAWALVKCSAFLLVSYPLQRWYVFAPRRCRRC